MSKKYVYEYDHPNAVDTSTEIFAVQSPDFWACDP